MWFEAGAPPHLCILSHGGLGHLEQEQNLACTVCGDETRQVCTASCRKTWADIHNSFPKLGVSAGRGPGTNALTHLVWFIPCWQRAGREEYRMRVTALQLHRDRLSEDSDGASCL